MAAPFFPALQERAARRYFLGQSASIIGNWTQSITLNLLLWDSTHSPALLGVLNFLLYGPMLFVPLAFGARLQPTSVKTVTMRVLFASLSLSVGLSIAQSVTSLGMAWVLCAGAAAGVIGALEMPSRQLLLTTVLRDRSALIQAVATNTVVFNVGRMVGPAVAALIYAHLGAVYGFSLTAIGVLFMIVMVWGLPAPAGQVLTPSRKTGRLRAALDYVRLDPFARQFVPVLVCMGVLATLRCIPGSFSSARALAHCALHWSWHPAWVKRRD